MNLSNIQKTKKEFWQTAIGMLKIDNQTPSEDMMRMIEMEIQGKITEDEILINLQKKYNGAMKK